MLYLITEAELEAYLGVTLDTTTAESIIKQVETYIHNYCNVPTFEEQTGVVERFEFEGTQPYCVRYPNPSNLTEINGVAFSDTYRFRGRILEFAPTVQLFADTTWYDISFKYNAGYAAGSDELDEIKQAGFLVSQNIYRNSQATPGASSGVSQYTIGDLTEKFGNVNGKSTENGEAEGGDLYKSRQLLAKYVFSNVISN